MFYTLISKYYQFSYIPVIVATLELIKTVLPKQNHYIKFYWMKCSNKNNI